MGTIPQALPPPHKRSALIKPLKKLAEDQGKDADVIADMKMQGKTKPTDLGIFWEYVVIQEELFVIVGMMGRPFVQPLYSSIKLSAPGHRPDQYDGEYLAVIGDHTEEAGPPHIKVKKTYFEWREVKIVKEVDDDSRISNSTIMRNRLKCFDLATATPDQETVGIWSPKLPIIPVNVAIKVAKKPSTGWELFCHLWDYEGDNDTVEKAVLEQTKNLALVVSCKGANSAGSLMVMHPANGSVATNIYHHPP